LLQCHTFVVIIGSHTFPAGRPPTSSPMVHASFLDVLTEDVVVYLAVSHVLGSQYVESVVAMLKTHGRWIVALVNRLLLIDNGSSLFRLFY
jgi:hypothetical protein